MNYVSLGSSCSIAYQLQILKLKKESLPFDWIRSNNLPYVLNLIQNNFTGFFDDLEHVKDDERFPFIEDNEIEHYIQNNSNDVFFLSTNCHLRGEITEECKDFIKHILTPNEEFQKYINDSFIFYNIPENYHILHFRLGDSFLIRNQESTFLDAIYIFNQCGEDNDLLISDSLSFKEKIKDEQVSISSNSLFSLS